MAMQQGTQYIANNDIDDPHFDGLNGKFGHYVTVIGDGVSKTISVDLWAHIEATKSVKNKMPTGAAYAVDIGSGTAVGVTVSGTVATLTWATAVAANTAACIGIVLTFNP